MKHNSTIRGLLIILAALCFFPGPLWGESDQAELLKAGFLGKFAEFTRFPSEKQSAESPFTLTLLGDTPLKAAVQKIYKNGTIKNREVTVQFISDVARLGETDLLFIAASEKKRLPKILATLKGKPILTVSNSPGFAQKGVHINLYLTTKGTLHFEMNRKRLENDGLKVHLRLMELAKVVN